MDRYDPLRWWHTDPVRRQRVKDLMVWVCVLLAFVAAYFAGSAKTRSDHVSDCTVHTLSQLLDVQNERSDLASPARDAGNAELSAWKDLLTEILANPGSKSPQVQEQLTQDFQAYLTKVQEAVDANTRLQSYVDAQPLPTADQLMDCVR